MKRIETKFEAFVLGFVVGIIVIWAIPGLFFKTHYYKATDDLILENNIIIPKNTEFTLYKDMPEGFKMYAFCVAIESENDFIMKKISSKNGGWINGYPAKPKNLDRTINRNYQVPINK